MKRHLIIKGTAVYEIDEDCMLKKRVDKDRGKTEKQSEKEKEKNGGV